MSEETWLMADVEMSDVFYSENLSIHLVLVVSVVVKNQPVFCFANGSKEIRHPHIRHQRFLEDAINPLIVAIAPYTI